MTCTRIYATKDGETHFEDVEITFSEVDFAPPASPIHLSPVEEAQQVGFLRVPAHWEDKQQTAPVKAYYLFIRGTWEITTSEGETRRFHPGSFLRVEDTKGKGHTTRMTSGTEGLAVVIQLPDDPPGKKQIRPIRIA